jgi:CelD/BcsL family acetyltransferase involved in cellulose biosynthesis
MQLEIINPLHYPAWDDLIRDTRGSTIFHTSFWARVLHDSYNYQPRYLGQIQDGKITTLLPVMEINSFLTGRRGVSLPFTDYCDPIVGDTNEWLNALDCLKDHGEKAKWRYLELRGGADLMAQIPCSSSYYRHTLGLSKDVDALHAQLKASTKRNIKKAVREGVAVARKNSPDALKIFYHLHCLTRKKHGVPPQPFYFFERLYDHIISRGHGQIVVAEHEGKTIAAAVYLHFGNEAVYKFGASDIRCLHLRPNDLVMWEAIQWYCRNNYSRLCMGRTDLVDEGLRQYKCGWGAEERALHYLTYDFAKKAFRPERSRVSGRHNALMRNMPIPVLKAAGYLLYRHMG